MNKIFSRHWLDRWLYSSLWVKLVVLTVVTIFIFFMVAVPLSIWFADDIGYYNAGHDHPLWQLYYFFVDSGNQMSMERRHGIPGEISQLGRFIAFVMSTLGWVLLGGLLISTITSAFERRAEKWKSGLSYYGLKNHVVVIGSDQMVPALVNQISQNSNHKIVVMTSQNVEQLRNVLHADLRNPDRYTRIIVNYGQRDSEKYLRAVNITKAKEVYILGDGSEFDDIENYHDSLNVRTLMQIAKLCQADARKKLPCHVLFDYSTTYRVFQHADLPADVASCIEFHPFNFDDFWARKVLVVGRTKEDDIHYEPLDWRPITSVDSPDYVHFIIIGFSKMGQAMALQAAHIAHYPNYRKRKTRITIIDANGLSEMHHFKQKCGELFKVSRSTFIDADRWAEAESAQGRALPADEFTRHTHLHPEYAHLVEADDPDKDFIDVEWQFINGSDSNPVVARLLAQYADDPNAIVTVAVCLNRTHQALRAAMHLPHVYYEKSYPVTLPDGSIANKKIPILVQQRMTASLTHTLNAFGNPAMASNLKYANLRPFGMVYDCYDIHLASLLTLCNRVNFVYEFTANGHGHPGDIPTEIDPDRASQMWHKLPVTQQWSNIYSATSIPTKIRCLGVAWNPDHPVSVPPLSPEQINMLAEMEHNRWNIEKLLMGFRPVNLQEQNALRANTITKSQLKKRFIHCDIRPFSGLDLDENNNRASVYDINIVTAIPLILTSITSNTDKKP